MLEKLCVGVGKIRHSPRPINYVIYFPQISCPYESRVLSNNNSPKCIIEIVLDSVKKRHNVERTTNRSEFVELHDS